MSAGRQHKTRIYAHRGANRLALENTRNAFDQALTWPIDGIETDVQMTKDKVLVLYHDRNLNRFGMPDKRVDEFDYQALNVLSLQNENHIGCFMKLEEFLSLYTNRCEIDLEIKCRDYETIERYQQKVELSIQLINDYPRTRLFLSTFSLSCLEYAHQCDPNLRVFYILKEEYPVQVEQILQDAPFLSGVCFPINTVEAQHIESLHSADKEIGVYTCNDEHEIKKAYSLSVDLLFSDDPKLALKLRP